MQGLITIITQLFYQLVTMSITATLVGVVILLVRRWTDILIAPKYGTMLWIVMLISLITPYRIPISYNVNLTHNIDNIKLYEFIEDEINIINMVDNKFHNEDIISPIIESKSTMFNIKVVLPIIWIIGIFISILYYIVSRFHLISKIKANQKLTQNCILTEVEKCKTLLCITSPIKVITQEYLKTPALIGVLSPTIILPTYVSHLEDDGLKYVLLHELLHYKQKHLWIHTLLYILKTLYWFNPIIPFLFRNLMEDLESCNDQLVIEAIGGNIKGYANTLIEVLNLSNSPKYSLMCMAGEFETSKRRFLRIKKNKKYKKSIIFLCFFSIILISVFLTTYKKTNDFNLPQVENISSIFLVDNIGKSTKTLNLPEVHDAQTVLLFLSTTNSNIENHQVYGDKIGEINITSNEDYVFIIYENGITYLDIFYPLETDYFITMYESLSVNAITFLRN